MLTPRIAPLPEAEWDDEVRQIIGNPPSDFLATLVRNRRLYRRWSGFANKLLRSHTLPDRDFEIVVLRTAWRCQGAFEWGEHVPRGLAAGLSHEDIERVIAGPDAEGWTHFDRHLVRAVDELHSTSRISDATWGVLAERYDASLLIELVMAAGQYLLVAWLQNSLGVKLRDGSQGLAAR